MRSEEAGGEAPESPVLLLGLSSFQLIFISHSSVFNRMKIPISFIPNGTLRVGEPTSRDKNLLRRTPGSTSLLQLFRINVCVSKHQLVSPRVSSKQLTEAVSQGEEHVRGTTAATAPVFLFLPLPGLSVPAANGQIPRLLAPPSTDVQTRCSRPADPAHPPPFAAAGRKMRRL